MSMLGTPIFRNTTDWKIKITSTVVLDDKSNEASRIETTRETCTYTHRRRAKLCLVTISPRQNRLFKIIFATRLSWTTGHGSFSTFSHSISQYTYHAYAHESRDSQPITNRAHLARAESQNRSVQMERLSTSNENNEPSRLRGSSSTFVRSRVGNPSRGRSEPTPRLPSQVSAKSVQSWSCWERALRT